MDIRPYNANLPQAVTSSESGTPPSQPRTAAPVQTVDAVRESAAAPSMQQLSDAVKSINKALQAQGQGVEFSIDSESEQTVVKVVDHETKEVLRQIPSVEALEIAKALDKAQGLLISQKA